MENLKVAIRSKESGSTKSLLKNDMVPGIIYGKDSNPTKVFFENKVLKKLIDSGGFYSKIIDVEIDGKSEKVLPKEIQYHPVTDRLIHFDFLRVHENTKVTVAVPVVFLNQEVCPGLKKGGVLNLVRRLVELNCKASSIPEKLEYDLIESEIGDSVKISDINLPEDVQPTITDRDFVIATLVPPTVEIEEETKTEDEGEEGEGEGEGAESEAKDEKTENKDKKEENKEEKKEASPEDKSK